MTEVTSPRHPLPKVRRARSPSPPTTTSGHLRHLTHLREHIRPEVADTRIKAENTAARARVAPDLQEPPRSSPNSPRRTRNPAGTGGKGGSGVGGSGRLACELTRCRQPRRRERESLGTAGPSRDGERPAFCRNYGRVNTVCNHKCRAAYAIRRPASRLRQRRAVPCPRRGASTGRMPSLPRQVRPEKGALT